MGGVTAVISVACSLLARTYLTIGAGGGMITLLQCASFSFVITIADFVRAKVYYFKALRRGDKIARGDAYRTRERSGRTRCRSGHSVRPPRRCPPWSPLLVHRPVL